MYRIISVSSGASMAENMAAPSTKKTRYSTVYDSSRTLLFAIFSVGSWDGYMFLSVSETILPSAIWLRNPSTLTVWTCKLEDVFNINNDARLELKRSYLLWFIYFLLKLFLSYDFSGFFSFLVSIFRHLLPWFFFSIAYFIYNLYMDAKMRRYINRVTLILSLSFSLFTTRGRGVEVWKKLKWARVVVRWWLASGSATDPLTVRRHRPLVTGGIEPLGVDPRASRQKTFRRPWKVVPHQNRNTVIRLLYHGFRYHCRNPGTPAVAWKFLGVSV